MTQNEKSKIRAKVIKWVTRLFLILVAIIMLYPLAWNVVSSFKTSTEFLTDPFAWPQGFAWDNYARAYEKSNLAANIGNSIYVVLETLVIILVCVVPCSYCLVRYKFPGAKLILNIYMAAIFIQATYIMIPLFLQMNKLNLLNRLTALAYKACRCRGVVRVDFIVTPEGKPYLIEINSIPGMSGGSIVPKQVREAGMTLGELYDLIIEDTYDRDRR